MKNIILIVLMNIISILLVFFSFQLAMAGKDGWGWFLFVALLIATDVPYKKLFTKKSEKEIKS